ncbi:MAG: ABC transporter substrate-binding protein [Bacteroidetes bacterium]|jgi:branched-chain amino acid transport system substrate-binding protein|nr:ABC transporter substrate-binding protein [Bacteroidota bacterium]
MNLFLKPTTLICCSLVLLLMQSCTKENTTQISSRQILVGALIPISGAGSSPGAAGFEGLQLAVNEIQTHLQQYNPSWRFDVQVEDTETDTLVALSKYNKLKANGIKIIIGPYSSTVLKSLKPHADRDGILLISPASVASSITLEGDNVFRLLPNVTSQGEAMTALLIDDQIEVIIPLVRNDIWGSELLEATTQQFSAAGFTADLAVFYDPAAVDFSGIVEELSIKLENQLTQTEASKIGIYMLSYGEGYEFVKAAKELPLFTEVKWYGSSAFAEDQRIITDYATAVFASEHQLWCPSFGLDPEAAPIWKPLMQQMEANLNRKPEIFAFTSYDATWLSAKTYLEVQHQAGFEILKENFVLQANQYFGATGWTSLNAAGDRNLAAYDFWGLETDGNSAKWENKAIYNNITKKLTRLD